MSVFRESDCGGGYLETDGTFSEYRLKGGVEGGLVDGRFVGECGKGEGGREDHDFEGLPG